MAPQFLDEETPLLSEQIPERYEDLRGHISKPVGFDPNGDPDNPLDWSARFKWSIVALLAFMSFTVTFNCFSIVPVARHIVEDLDGANAPSDASVLPVTIWELGEAAGPIFIGPLSEVAGRYRIINFTNLIFILATALAALSQNNSMFIFSRALTGMAVATNVLNPAIVGDIFPPEERGAAMSFIMFAPLLGGTIGPALSGLLSEALGWRCVLWICVVLASICQLAFFTYFRETYSVVILRRRASKVCKEMGRNSLSYTLAENSSIGDSQVSLWLSIGRPAAVLFGSGVLIAMTVFGSVVFAHIYVLSVTLPGILEDVYGLPSTAVGLVFLAHGFGSFISVMLCKLCLDKIYIKLRKKNNGIGLPEHRLPMAILGGLTLVPALALYGWCAEYRMSLALFIISVICTRFSLLLVIIPLMAYVVDASGFYSASALTGIIVFRCLAGAFMPLSTPPIIRDLGYGWGFSALACAILVLCLVPILVQSYGPRWRLRSKYTRDC